jgi:phenylpyruvate tautomerase PptA (4-oxalocrotonate tautomerase family)
MIIIYGIDERLNPIKAQMSEVLHQCMVDVLGMPKDKRVQRFIPMKRDDFFYPSDRSERYTFIEINMMAGRTEDTKKRLIKAIFEAFEVKLAIKPLDVEITINEQPAHCWGFRGITGDEAKLNYKVNV